MGGCCSRKYQQFKENNDKTDPDLKPMDDLNYIKPLMYCNDFHPLHFAIRKGCHHIIPILLRCGAEINARDESGQTSLHLACETLNQEATEILLRCGANINLQTLYAKETALHLAILSSFYKDEILAEDRRYVELLLFNGANVHMKDWRGHEAIHRACINAREDIIMVLYNYGADMNSLTEQEESPLFLFMDIAKNLRKVNVLKKLLSLTYPLKLINREGRLPRGLRLPSCKQLKDMLMREALVVWSLQDICKFNIKKLYIGPMKDKLKQVIPTELWNSIYIKEEYSYASRINDYFVSSDTPFLQHLYNRGAEWGFHVD